MKKGIIVVSFGTSYKETRKRCIESIEDKIRNTFSDYDVQRAFTSNMVIKKIQEKEGLKVNKVDEAIKEMKDKGIKEILLQPLHIIPGYEYEKIQHAVKMANHHKGMKVELNAPLLNHEADYDEVVKSIIRRLPEEKSDEGIILMGHGTEHHANACYSMLQAKFRDVRSDVFIANVEGYPELEHIQSKLSPYRKMTLMPLMIVAGDHAQNDMAGNDDDSYKSIISEMGIEVECILEGLGEQELIQNIFVERVENSL